MPPGPAPFPWHREAITEAMADTLADLQQRRVTDGFYLAGGTALALALGHRRSIDLDFFASQAFDTDAILSRIESAGDFRLVSRETETLHVTIGSVKVSFLGFRYPQLFPPLDYSGVAVAEPREIACMKVNAMASRGSRRDFVDLFFAARQFDLRDILRWFTVKFARTHYSPVHVVKSFTFFDEAEKEPMPDMLLPCGWPDVRRYFEREAPRLL